MSRLNTKCLRKVNNAVMIALRYLKKRVVIGNQFKKVQELLNKFKSDSECLAKTMRQLKIKAAKENGTLESSCSKAVSLERRTLIRHLAPLMKMKHRQLL